MLVGFGLLLRRLWRRSRRVRTASLLVGIGLVSSSCSPPPPPATFEGWEIMIDQPIRQLEQTLASLEQQQPMNYTIANISFLYDAKLYILFREFIERLPESARTTEINEQRKWLKQRHTQVKKAYARYEGGTLAPYNAAEADIAFTKRRIAVVEEKKKLSERKRR
ncbi:MAG: lysozyme inhibitor LprI family protein [Verrucomicrobiia bacterium]